MSTDSEYINNTPVVRNFLALFPTRVEALKFLNDETGKKYSHPTLYSWCNPNRPDPSQETYEVMVRHILLQLGDKPISPIEMYEMIRFCT